MRKIILLLLLLMAQRYGFGQAWSGILAPARAIDWSGAGLPATLPTGETHPKSLDASDPNTMRVNHYKWRVFGYYRSGHEFLHGGALCSFGAGNFQRSLRFAVDIL